MSRDFGNIFPEICKMQTLEPWKIQKKVRGRGVSRGYRCAEKIFLLSIYPLGARATDISDLRGPKIAYFLMKTWKYQDTTGRVCHMNILTSKYIFIRLREFWKKFWCAPLHLGLRAQMSKIDYCDF